MASHRQSCFHFKRVPSDIRHLCRWHHQHLSCAAVYIYQAFARSCGADQALSGALYRKVQALAPGNGIIAVHLEHIVLKLNLDQLLFRAFRFDTEHSVPIQAQVKQSLSSGHCRREIGTHHRFVLQGRFTG